jgi:oligosaccharyltransferase complex subunit beta
MKSWSWLSILFTALALGPVSILSAKDTLVLIDNLAIKETHSTFFQTLRDNGYQLTFKMSDDAGLSVSKYGVWLYQNLIIFAPGTDEFGGDLSPEGVAQFVDAGGNVLIAGSPHAGDAIRDLAAEFGLELDDAGSYVIDHINAVAELDSGKHTVIKVDAGNLIDAPVIVGSKRPAPLLYEGSGIMVDAENPLVLELLTASSSAYSYDPDKSVTEYPHTVGKNTVLIGALQARNNARVVFTGSMNFFSDNFFSAKVGQAKSGNEDLVKALTQWVFKETGVLRLSNVTHHKAGERGPPSSYTITEDVVYSVVIEELQDGVWTGYKATDIQLEFVRIDPFVRTALKAVSGRANGLYETRFKIPDVYGVFQFKIDYQRKGYTFLSSATQVSVRPLQHTQYERFIPSAFPYYASAFSMMIGVLIFSCVFLHYKEKDKSD